MNTRIIVRSTLLFIIFGLSLTLNAQSPDALFSVESNSQGILIPSMTNAQKNAIHNPSEGLLIYQKTSPKGFYFYNGSAWVLISDATIVASSADQINDEDNDTKIMVEESPDEDIIRFDLGGTECWRLTGPRLEPDNNGNSLFIGKDAGRNDDLAYNLNVFLGNYSGSENTSGNKNTSVGFRSFQKSITGNLNTAIGFQSLFNNISGPENTALGANALLSNTTGSRNTSIGKSSLDSNISGSRNTAVGVAALATNTTGSYNTAIGHAADVLSPNLSKATAIGYRAMVGSSNSIVLGGTGADGVNVGIGTTSPTDRLHVVGNIKMVDGNQGSGKFLSSNANGVGSWQNLPVDPDEDPSNEIQNLESVLTHGNSAANNKISNLMDPAADQDAATKNYVDDLDAAESDARLAGDDKLQMQINADTDGDSSNEIQTLDVSQLNGTNLELSLSSDGEATKSIDLSSLQDGTGTDDQTLTEVLAQGNDANATKITNLADPTADQDAATKKYVDDNDDVDDADASATNELNTSLSLSGTTLTVTDSGGGKSVDLASLQDGTGTDDQTLSLDANSLSIESGNSVNLSSFLDNTDDQTLTEVLAQGADANATKITNLADPTADQDAATKKYVDDNDDVDDADASSTNELNTSLTLSGTTLTVTDSGGGKSADLSSLQDGTGTDDQTLTEVLGEGASAGNSAITNLADPSNDQDAATKKYVDDNDDGGTLQPTGATSYNIRARDEGTVAGNARGENSVDLQTSRVNATEVASGALASVLGGYSNTASGDTSTVAGGSENMATADRAFIGGGFRNTASFRDATVAGGEENTASGSNAFVGGGESNVASGLNTTVSGGDTNIASGDWSTISGGDTNTASGDWSTIGGGDSNLVTDDDATIGGGYGNQALNNGTTIAGGTMNETTGRDATIGGGYTNEASGDGSTIAGGVFNIASGELSTIIGGIGNIAAFDGMSVAGQYNEAFLLKSLPPIQPLFVVGNGSRDDDRSNALVILNNGHVGIGNIIPDEALHVDGNIKMIDGTQGSGKVLTSNASGVGTWTSLPTNNDNDATNEIQTLDVSQLSGTNLQLSLSSDGEATKTIDLSSLQDGTGGTVQGTGSNTYNIRASNEGTTAGNARGENSVDLQPARNSASQVASGEGATIAGGRNNTASHTETFVGGGLSNTASSFYSTVAGGSNNTSSGSGAFVGGGSGNQASSSSSSVVGGQNNIASGVQSSMGGGNANAASGSKSTVGGGEVNNASGSYSTVPGGTGNIAESYGEIVVGIFNEASGGNSGSRVDTDPVFVVGNGTSTSVRSNAVVVLKNGNVGIGDNTPDNELHVVGNIKMVDGNQGANKVMTSDADGVGSWMDLPDSGGTIQGTGSNTYNIRASNEGTTAGNARGENSVDLQTTRSDAAKVASGNSATIGGGEDNTASGNWSTIGGGDENTASAYAATVGGGYGNVAIGNNNTIGGGYDNAASDFNSTVSGGTENIASGSNSTVGGGAENTASGSNASVGGGGFRNTASGDYAAVGGGEDNTASGNWSTIGGGDENTASAYAATVGGGYGNVAIGNNNTIGGGYDNAASDFNSTVSGGTENIASGSNSTVGGGAENTASGSNTSVGGGFRNTASGSYSSVAGGLSNTADSYGETVVGIYNEASGGAEGSIVSTDPVFVVGNGTSTLARSNAVVVLKNGNVGIGDNTPDNELHVVGNIKMVDGNEASGKVLTSDANGVGSWTDLPANNDNSATNEIQTLDVSQLNGTNLELSLSSDGEVTKSIDLSSLQDGIGTDDQTLTEVLAQGNDANATKITNLADPTADQDAATKKYVDDNSGAALINAGSGMTKSGNNLNVIGSSTIIANSDDLEVNSSSTSNQILLSSGSVGVAAVFGALPIGDSNAVSGTLGVENGGTGTTSHSSGNVLVGAGTSPVTSSKSAPSGDFVGTNDTQTLSNKTLTDNGTYIQDNNDITKKLQFELSNVSTATTRILTIPNANTTVVGTDAAQVITNKTIDSDNNTITNIDNSNIKSGAAINAAKIADGSVSNTEFQQLSSVGSAIVGIDDTQTLTNKTLTDNVTYIQDNSDNTKKIQFELSNISTSTTRTLSIPDANTTVVGDNTLQALTNKTIDSDNNTLTNITNSSIKSGAAIDAAKIADGSVSNTEFQRLSSVGSAIVGTSDTQTLTNKTLTSNTNNINSKGLHSATTVVDVSAATAPTTGQVLKATSSTAATWQTLNVNDADADASNEIQTLDVSQLSGTNLQLSLSSDGEATKSIDLSSLSGGTTQGTGSNTYNIRSSNEGTTAGNARGEYSVDLQTSRSSASQVASGAYSLIGGGVNNTASGNHSLVAGGSTNTASGAYSLIGGGVNNTASGNHSLVAGGSTNTASGYRATAVGGWQNSVSGEYAFIGGGFLNLAGANRATVVGGYQNNGSQQYASIGGGQQNVASGQYSSIPGGYGNLAESFGETVVGIFNVDLSGSSASNFVSTDPIFIIGNGINSSNRSNAVLVRKNGNVGIGSNAPDEELHVEGSIKMVDGNEGAGKVLTSDANGVGSWTDLPANNDNSASNEIQTLDVSQLTGTNLELSLSSDGEATKSIDLSSLQDGAGGTVQGTGANTYNIRASNEGTTVGNARGENSVDLQTVRSSNTQVASGAYSVLGGGVNNTNQGWYAVVGGGSNNSALGSLTTIGGGGDNTAIANYSSVPGGRGLIAESYSETVVGIYNTASGGSLGSIVATDPVFIVGNGTADMARSNAVLVRKNGNVGIGSNAPGEKLEVNGALRLADSSAPTSASGFSGLYSAAGELNAYDASGNTTVISPHNFSLIKASENMAWSFYSKNEDKGLQVNVDMMRLTRLVEKISGEKLVYIADMEGNLKEEGTQEGELEKLKKENRELKERLAKIEALLGIE